MQSKILESSPVHRVVACYLFPLLDFAHCFESVKDRQYRAHTVHFYDSHKTGPKYAEIVYI